MPGRDMSEFQYADMSPRDSLAVSDRAYEGRSAIALHGDSGVDIARLVDTLPKLGAVLWLERQSMKCAASIAFAPRCRLFVPDPGLRALCTCRHLTAHSAVTPYGPREWLCFRDGDDVARGKLFLLPDTDYFAWEELGKQAMPLPKARLSIVQRSFARLSLGWRAHLLRFDLQHAARLRRLDAHAPAQISRLGLELAGAIARSVHADFFASAPIA